MFKTVIWASDGSDLSERALPVAKALIDRTEGRLVVMHVRELLTGRAHGQPVHADEAAVIARVREHADQLRSEGYSVTLKVVTTYAVDAGHAIAQQADELGAEAVVVGTRGRGPLAAAVLGSVTQRLFQEATCPVVAVPPHALVPEAALV